MNEPIQLLHMGAAAPDLSTSAYGPFVVHEVPSLDDLAQALDSQHYDAIVLHQNRHDGLRQLALWPGLARAVLDAAVLVVAPEPASGEALRLVQLGAQDVLPPHEAHPAALARAMRLAVERKRLERAARKAYATDLATGLPNHGQLMEHMNHLLALREREPAVMALLALRIEGLAATEARLGTESANVLRRKVAVRLRSGLRASDVVAAVGVDTFAVLLAWIDDAGDGERVAVKLAQSLQRPFTVAGQDVAVAVCVGVSQYPQHGKDADTLLRRALGQAVDGRPIGRSGLSPHAGGAAAANDD
ncbi:MAG: GGDEF domain-containing protein [Burkholderiaceae bacterium]|jgi:diguanylate cyclase (GGDEF)-like protein|nr:GGDEF domain-containing protein [Burkholderiaceae bacterium]